jgi:hypothetical protein
VTVRGQAPCSELELGDDCDDPTVPPLLIQSSKASCARALGKPFNRVSLSTCFCMSQLPPALALGIIGEIEARTNNGANKILFEYIRYNLKR